VKKKGRSSAFFLHDRHGPAYQPKVIKTSSGRRIRLPGTWLCRILLSRRIENTGQNQGLMFIAGTISFIFPLHLLMTHELVFRIDCRTCPDSFFNGIFPRSRGNILFKLFFEK